MRIAFGIVRLFPEGGLQRDCLRLARLLMERGHTVTIFTSENRCVIPEGLALVLLPVRHYTNHGWDWAFAVKFAAAGAGRFDRIVGFNKLIGLDFFYCADPPVDDLARGFWRRLLPRYRTRSKLEAACFSPQSATRILALTHAAVDAYRSRWRIGADRFTVISAGIDDRRRRPELREATKRAALRAAFDLPPRQPVWLWIGAQPRTKGLDRAIAALPAQPNALLLVAGVTADDGGRAAAVQARQLGVAGRVRFFGYREDVVNLFAVADLLVHPARLEVSGQVILEALVNGLPAIVSGCCGFAEQVHNAKAGIVLEEPFAQAALERAIARAGDPAFAAELSRNGIDYGRTKVSRDGLSAAADVIEGG